MLKIENLVIEKSAGKRILRGLNATFEQGKLNAIMGPNGTGKSTLLDAIYGKSTDVTNVSGRILFNEQERDSKTWNSTISYVEQEPFFVKNQTARDLITFSINMKNAADKTDYKLSDFEEMLEALNLNKILDVDENLLSGGERKRVMLAIEIVQMKSILMLDEPISDLDSHLAMKLLIYLKSMAVKRNIIVILTIHQPSEHIFKQLDNLLFISNGVTAYTGSTADVSKVLESHDIIKPVNWNMAEFLFEIFYSSCLFPEIVVLKPAVDKYVKKCNENALSSLSALKYQRFKTPIYNLSINMKQSGIILYRGIRISLKKKSFFLKFVIIYFFYFNSISNFINMSFDLSPILFAGDGATSSLKFIKYEKSLLSKFGRKEIEYINGYFENLLVPNMISTYLILSFFSFDVFCDLNQLKKETFKGFYTPITFFIASLAGEFLMSLMDLVSIVGFLIHSGIFEIISLRSWILIFISMVSMRILKMLMFSLSVSDNQITSTIISTINNIVLGIITFDFRIFILFMFSNDKEGLKYKALKMLLQAVAFIYPPIFTKSLMLLLRVRCINEVGSALGDVISVFKNNELGQYMEKMNTTGLLNDIDPNSVNSEITKTVGYLLVSSLLLFSVFAAVLINSFTPRIILKTK